ncbi:hypothetical protein CPB86DRAFT_87686 [Serendipita vermifera]|nr:hypothetical protein CPB86DRAFT_87686 [Serendipita vermifera]
MASHQSNWSTSKFVLTHPDHRLSLSRNLKGWGTMPASPSNVHRHETLLRKEWSERDILRPHLFAVNCGASAWKSRMERSKFVNVLLCSDE